MSESRERRDELSSNRNFSISQRQRKEVSVEVLTSEIDHVKKMVDDLQLPSPAVDIGISCFRGFRAYQRLQRRGARLVVEPLLDADRNRPRGDGTVRAVPVEAEEHRARREEEHQ